MGLTNADMERMAIDLRTQLSLGDSESLDPFKINITGVKVLYLDDIPDLPKSARNQLTRTGAKSWSAMSVPLDKDQDKWVILINQTMDKERQRVSLLEELWHIIQGHQLTSVVKVGTHYGRSFGHEEEHDAFFLAAATLLPVKSLRMRVKKKQTAEKIASEYGISKELVEYRIKRCGLWSEYKGKKISLNT